MPSRTSALSDFSAVILAAGKGTRLRSDLAKVLHRAGGRTLVEHVVRACMPLRAREIAVIVGHQAEDVAACAIPLGANPILQQPQFGTGHALRVAQKKLNRRSKYVLVLPGDAPLIRTETLERLAHAHLTSGAAATILTAILADPAGYGRIIRKSDNSVARIVEEKAATPEERAIQEINSSIYAFTLETLWPCLDALRPENVHKELYLTDAVAVLNQRGLRVLAEVAADSQEVLGCNTRAELAEVDRIFRDRKRRALMDSGVTIFLPETVLIDPDVRVGEDTVIEPSVHLFGKTRIGANCTIRAGSVLTDVLLEDGVTVREHSILTASRVRSGARIGPFSHLRDGAEIGPGARVGNYVEVKKSRLGQGVKAQHLTYIGDASIGRGTNIGAGTITCNYDGVSKNRTAIGNQVFIGSNTALVAPVRIGARAYVAAGSTITENVPADGLGIARGRQSNKPGWAAARRKAMAAAAAPPKRAKKRPHRRRTPRRRPRKTRGRIRKG
ncbi:MAG TPA: bifunctional UDP-N-acetylglucosamine diphosphorylase/glucosamine-1-phosphate N-acetyltransferase GlmU [Candidatus Acidoferrales bacterium]|nr:bifunctional UDP-N-acetylglucosamine diphosphorylase/glucosamine-1-phosphate N-acetyltransferase GlmU [Candidatus Acidoferrales bacterium]